MQKTNVGSIEITALLDLQAAYPATAVYPDIPDAGRFAQYLDPTGGVTLAFSCFLVRDGDVMLLVDTGWGPEHQGRLLDELAGTGVAPGEVTHVLFTHLHGDHTGWNIDRETGRPIFANARHLVPEADWEHYSKAEPVDERTSRSRPQLSSFERDVRPLERFGLLDLVSGERTISPGLRTMATPGHTPGHTSVVVTSGGENGFILGDVVITPLDAEEPGLETIFDGDRGLAVRTRTATVERLIADQALVAASHLPAPGFGRFVRTEGRQYWKAL
jgi:glyoxylase-like metal-dependent hydrolase (beta-lactamase superfamily II)